MIELAGYILSFAAGLMLGLIGGGGSMLIIPILIYLFSFGAVEATSYSLFIVGITSLSGAAYRYRSARLDMETGLIFGIPSILAVFIMRKWIIPAIPEAVLSLGDFILTRRLLILWVFSILVILAAVFMINRKYSLYRKPVKPKMSGLVIQGTFIGFVTGFVGMGGGFLIVPSLYFFAGIPIQTAIGTTLFIIAIKSLIGFAGDAMNYSMDWKFLAIISMISIAGVFTGTYFSERIKGETLKKVFGWLILILGITILVKESLF